jgi:hypothetical protein
MEAIYSRLSPSSVHRSFTLEPFPAVCGELPAKLWESPARLGELPAKLGELPAELGELPAELGESPAICKESSATEGLAGLFFPSADAITGRHDGTADGTFGGEAASCAAAGGTAVGEAAPCHAAGAVRRNRLHVCFPYDNMYLKFDRHDAA